MTARPVGDGDGHDRLREVLAEALTTAWARGVPFDPEQGGGRIDFARYADALLPVVTAWAEQRARERAAAELRAAADELAYAPAAKAAWLRDRAAALAADDRTGQR